MAFVLVIAEQKGQHGISVEVVGSDMPQLSGSGPLAAGLGEHLKQCANEWLTKQGGENHSHLVNPTSAH